MRKDMFLTNTLTGKKELFIPKNTNTVKVYSCGPTVYDYAHIGNFRSFLMSDLLTRTLKYFGYKVIKVQNITDVGHLTEDDIADGYGEDKITQQAKKNSTSAQEVADFFAKKFIEDEKTLNISPPDHRPKATDYIAEQMVVIQDLINKDFAYESNGSVYFRIAKSRDYGELSKNKLKDLMVGARVEVSQNKENPLDFALWRSASPEHLMQWESPWGSGYPGWHIECSIMSITLLGEEFDIHTGGEDNIFPHHECEIAQNHAITGKKNSVRYWLHAKHLLVDGKKMSKSDRNFFTIRDLTKKGWKGNEIRYALAAAHYRTALNFTEKNLQDARNTIHTLQNAYDIAREKSGKTLPIIDKVITKIRENFVKALSDDLNVAEAIAVVFEGVKYLHAHTDDANITGQILTFLEEDMNQIFDILSTEDRKNNFSIIDKKEIEQQINERNRARKEKDWEKSDAIRDALEQKYNIQIIDTDKGGGWR